MRGIPQRGVGRRVRGWLRKASDLRYWLTLRRLGRHRDDAYRAYLGTQLRRTLSKRSNDPGVGTRILVERVAAECNRRDASVLCIGCRNGMELDVFRSRGFQSVVGIDLFTQRPDILVMDMHELQFEDDSFDVVYASHSLEHSYDLDRVAGEIVRVARDGALLAIEVPLRTRASAADRIEFDDPSAVEAPFRRHVAAAILVEEQPPWTSRNGQGTDIGRLVLKLEKAPSLAREARRITPDRRVRGARRPIGVAVAACAVMFGLLVGLPEALGDRPYDPHPLQLAEKAVGLGTAGTAGEPHAVHRAADAARDPVAPSSHERRV